MAGSLYCTAETEGIFKSAIILKRNNYFKTLNKIVFDTQHKKNTSKQGGNKTTHIQISVCKPFRKIIK